MRLLRALVSFFAVFTLTCMGIQAVLPPMQVPTVQSKLAFLQKQGDAFDALLIGSSRTYHQIIPEQFDGLMAAGNFPVKTFNLGVDGMRPPEDSYVLEKALAARTKPLKLVVVECNAIRASEREEDKDTIRAVYWHDFKRTWVMVRRAFFSDTRRRDWRGRFKKISEEWPDFEPHLRYWAWRSANLGRAHDLLMELLGLHQGRKPTASDLGPRKDGYFYYRTPHQDGMSAEELPLYRSRLAGELQKKQKPDYSDIVSQHELKEKQRMIEKAGGRMVVVSPPVLDSTPFQPRPESGLIHLDFTNPHKYPELFAPEHRADSGHLNEAGSKLYTQYVVREILAALKTAQPDKQ